MTMHPLPLVASPRTPAAAPNVAAPFHLGIIPDGSRRWGHHRGVSTADACRVAARKAVDATRWCRALGIRRLSAFALSQENVARRPAVDVAAVRDAVATFVHGLRGLAGVDLHLFGDAARLDRSHPDWSDVLASVNQHPDPAPLLTVHLGINHAGPAELTALLRAAETHGAAVVRKTLPTFLLSAGLPPRALVFRTGGQQRRSGFLPFQAAFAELCFCDTLWPDVERRDLEAALPWHGRQERRLGE